MEHFTEHLKGKVVKNVRHMTTEEAESWGFYKLPPILEFEDGSALVLMKDDEGNDGGAGLYINRGKEIILYTEKA